MSIVCLHNQKFVIINLVFLGYGFQTIEICR